MRAFPIMLATLMIGSLLLSSCSQPISPAQPTTTTPSMGAYASGVYPDLFADLLGKPARESQAKLDAAFQQLFYGDDDTQRVYYPVGEDMAYIADIGSSDVRSEGMSYGMMIAVQMDKQAEFNKLWQWTKNPHVPRQRTLQGLFRLALHS